MSSNEFKLVSSLSVSAFSCFKLSFRSFISLLSRFMLSGHAIYLVLGIKGVTYVKTHKTYKYEELSYIVELIKLK